MLTRDMHIKLFDPQTGWVQQAQNEFDDVKKKMGAHDGRIGVLENWRWGLFCGIGVIAWLIANHLLTATK